MLFENTMSLSLIREHVIYTNPSRAKEIREEMKLIDIGTDALNRIPASDERTQAVLSLRKRLCNLIDEIENLVDEKATRLMHDRRMSNAAMDM